MTANLRRRSIIFGIGCSACAAASYSMRPTHRTSETLPPIELEQQVPSSFLGWSVDRSLIPILPSPDVQFALRTIYNQVLARTYISHQGERIMLSIAYGSDQGTDATAAHRPEFCYTAQGFSIRTYGLADLNVGQAKITARRLIGQLNTRIEPITYWVTLNDITVLPGIERKLRQIQLGLMGQIPDGLLIRVSNISSTIEPSFQLHQRFLEALAASMPKQLLSRYFGRGA